MGPSDNPYAAPQSFQALPATNELSDIERVRKEHLSHEASIQSVGSLYALGGVIVLLVFGFATVGFLAEGRFEDILIALLFLAMGAFQLWVGIGLRGLWPSIKIPAGILAALGLLAIPLGTLINGYILYLLFSQKGGFILSPGYRQIIEATPHIRYRTSIIVWIFVGLLVLLVLGGIMVAILNGGR